VGEGETYRGRQRQRETDRYKEQVEEGGIQAKKTEVDKAGREREKQTDAWRNWHRGREEKTDIGREKQTDARRNRQR
jgi:hypothetical protein